MWTVYILKCNDESFYVGLTTDLKKRIQDHQSGDGAQYTRSRLPVKLVYSEKHANQNDAEDREQQIKRWSRTKKEALISGKI